MRARVLQLPPVRWMRLLGPVAAGLGSLAWVGPADGSVRGVVFLAALTLFFLAPLLRLRRPPREVELALGPGYVDVHGAGLVRRRIVGRTLTGATTAYVGDGVGLALQGRAPVTLEVAGDAEVKQLLDALGIGHHGFGRVEWLRAPSSAEGVLRGACVVGAAASGLLVLAVMANLLALGVIAGLLAVPCALFALGAYAARRGESSPAIALEPQGVVSRWPRFHIPYHVIEDVKGDDAGIWLRVKGEAAPILLPVKASRFGWNLGLGPEEREHVVAQIRAAVARARGLGPSAPTVAMQVADLDRHDADARTWLAKIDGIAERMGRGGSYRGTSFDQEELWSALENPEAPTDVRAAAARLLRRSDPASPARIERIAAAAREKTTERRIRIAMDTELDLASAAEEYDEAEGRAPRRSRVG